MFFTVIEAKKHMFSKLILLTCFHKQQHLYCDIVFLDAKEYSPLHGKSLKIAYIILIVGHLQILVQK